MEPFEPPSVNTDAFREAMRRLAGGVGLAMAQRGEESHAVTATGFSLSLQPPLLFLSLDRAGQLVRLVESAGHVGVSVLDQSHHRLAALAAERGRPMRLPAGLRTIVAVTGAPLLADALAWFDCTLTDVLSFGDHSVVVGRVVATWSRLDGTPLIYVDRAYHAIGEALAPPPEGS